MEMQNYCPVQLVRRDGEFNADGLNQFMRQTQLHKRGRSYSIIAVMGPQSSGKSTLLNKTFHTNFEEMDANRGRNETTQGIWIQKCAGVEPFMIAMDLEGIDGSERGEDDTVFEKQSALFAMAIADIVMINMWCHEVGLAQAFNKHLLRAVFRAMLRLFPARKTTLLFVLRDKTKTPLVRLEQKVKEDIEKIWNSIPKPTSHNSTPLSEFFKVEVTALPNYEEKEELFNEQVVELKQHLLNSISLELAGDRHGVVPAYRFSFSAEQIWKRIKENRDLDLPAHKVFVATVRCKEIANQKLHQLSSNEDWLALKGAVQSGELCGFGSKLSSILETCFSEYDKEVFYYDEGVRNEKREELVSKALDFVHPTYLKLLDRLRMDALESFKSRLEDMMNQGRAAFKWGHKIAASAESCADVAVLEFDQGCADAAIPQASWDTSEVRENLLDNISAAQEAIGQGRRPRPHVTRIARTAVSFICGIA